MKIDMLSVVCPLKAKSAKESYFAAVDYYSTLASQFEQFEFIVVGAREDILEFKTVTDSQASKLSGLRCLAVGRYNTLEEAAYVGLTVAIGDVALIALLGFDSPTVGLELVRQASKNESIAIGVIKRYDGFFYRLLQRLYYQLMSLFGISLIRGATLFTAIPRKYLNFLLKGYSKQQLLKALAFQIGLPITTLEYVPISEKKTFRSLRETIFLSLEGFVSLTLLPLRWCAFFCMLGSLTNFAYIFYIIAVRLSANEVQRGWPSLSLQVSFSFGVLLLTAAMIVQYIARLVDQSRPEETLAVLNEYYFGHPVHNLDQKNLEVGTSK